jgi:hypothetical protein
MGAENAVSRELGEPEARTVGSEQRLSTTQDVRMESDQTAEDGHRSPGPCPGLRTREVEGSK